MWVFLGWMVVVVGCVIFPVYQARYNLCYHRCERQYNKNAFLLMQDVCRKPHLKALFDESHVKCTTAKQENSISPKECAIVLLWNESGIVTLWNRITDSLWVVVPVLLVMIGMILFFLTQYWMHHQSERRLAKQQESFTQLFFQPYQAQKLLGAPPPVHCEPHSLPREYQSLHREHQSSYWKYSQ